MRGTEGDCRDIFESKISWLWTHHSAQDEREEREKKRKEKGRAKEKGEKKSGRDEEDKHDSRGMLKVRMRSIPRIASLSAEQTRRRRKREPLSSAKGD